MSLTEEQASSIKEQLLKQVANFPEEKREQLKSYITSMNNEQLEEFLRQNQTMSEKEGEAYSEEEQEGATIESNPRNKKPTTQCIMCLISSKQIPSFAIYEDKDYLAALEINPLSEGHTILIPKKHVKEVKSLKSKAFTLANKIGKHLVKKLKESKAENFQVSTSDDLKHAIINIIPIYKDKKMTGERKPADKQKLQELAIRIGELTKRKKIEKIMMDKLENKEKTTSEIKLSSKSLPQFNRRIP